MKIQQQFDFINSNQFMSIQMINRSRQHNSEISNNNFQNRNKISEKKGLNIGIIKRSTESIKNHIKNKEIRVKSHINKTQQQNNNNKKSPTKKILFIKNFCTNETKNSHHKRQSIKLKSNKKVKINNNNHSHQYDTTNTSQQQKLIQTCGSQIQFSQQSYYEVTPFEIQKEIMHETVRNNSIQKQQNDLEMLFQSTCKAKLNSNIKIKDEMEYSNQYHKQSNYKSKNLSQNIYDNLKQTNIKSCSNHYDKQAKYRIQHNCDSNQSYYCSKCAIKLVSQGYEAKQLSRNSNIVGQSNTNNKNYHRKQQVESILLMIDQVSCKLRINQRNSESLHNKLTLCFNEQMQVLNEYYKYLQKSITQQYQELADHLRYQYENNTVSIGQAFKLMKQIDEGINFVRNDILPNIESILQNKTLTDSNFKSIIDGHFYNLYSADTSLNNIVKGSLSYTVAIVPKDQVKRLRKQIDFFRVQLENQNIGGYFNPSHTLTTINNNLRFSFQQQVKDARDNDKYQPERLSFGKQVESPTFRDKYKDSLPEVLE